MLVEQIGAHEILPLPLGLSFHLAMSYQTPGTFFLGHATNNIVEYEVVIALRTNASTLGIRFLVVRLDSKLTISQLTSHYFVHNPMLYCKYLRVALLERSFDVIPYEHVPREFNMLSYSLDNEVLDWNLSH